MSPGHSKQSVSSFLGWPLGYLSISLIGFIRTLNAEDLSNGSKSLPSLGMVVSFTRTFAVCGLS